MERFHVIEDAAAILRIKGVYRQVKIYRRGDALFAGYGAGFVKLSPGGGTSHPNVSWLDVDLPSGMEHREIGFGVVISGEMKVIAA